MARYQRARNRKNSIFKTKKRQQDDRDRDEMEQLFRANETRKFYEKVNRSRKGFVPRADTCRDVEGNLVADRSEVMDGDGERADLETPEADDTFPAPDLQEIQQEIKKLKNNKAAGKDRLPAEQGRFTR